MRGADAVTGPSTRCRPLHSCGAATIACRIRHHRIHVPTKKVVSQFHRTVGRKALQVGLQSGLHDGPVAPVERINGSRDIEAHSVASRRHEHGSSYGCWRGRWRRGRRRHGRRRRGGRRRGRQRRGGQLRPRDGDGQLPRLNGHPLCRDDHLGDWWSASHKQIERLHGATAWTHCAARCAPSVRNITEADFDEIGSGGELDRPVRERTIVVPVEDDKGVQQRVGGDAPLARAVRGVARPTIAFPVASVGVDSACVLQPA
eukprot:scaffold4525_cov67-Phaeocystis_antarctica.AAC.3